MSQTGTENLPRVSVTQYGSTFIEGRVVPCCVGGDLMIYVPVIGVCEAVGLDAEEETQRIRGHHALKQGLVQVAFRVRAPATGEVETRDFPAIAFTRLHTWLASIPAERVIDAEKRSRLEAMQEHLADLIYAYMGRSLLPDELRDTHERGLPEQQRAFYASVEQISRIEEQLRVTDETLEQIGQRLKTVEVALSFGPSEASFIDKRQQEVYRAMIGIVGKLYQQKGRGPFENVEAGLKKDFDFTFYKVMRADQWEGVVRSLIHTYTSLTPAGAPLPQIFEDALKMKGKPPLNAQPGLF
jgi:hypothetical protein